MVAVGVIALSLAIAAPRAWRWWNAPPAGHCPICLRHEHKDSVVRFRAEGEGATEACCMSCALTYGRQTHKAVTILSVTDHNSGSALDPTRASFIVGSDVSPCLHTMTQHGAEKETYAVQWDRCLPSILAFASPQTADAFRAQHGGHLRSLDELLHGPVPATRGSD